MSAPQRPSSSSLLDEINKNHTAWLDGNKRARELVVSQCFKLISELETPGEAIVRMTWGQPCQSSALRTAVDMDVWRHIVTEDGSPVNCQQLAQATSTDPALMIRVMRTIASIGFAHEVDADTYVPTALTKAMTQFVYQDSVKFMIDACMPGNAKTADFLRDTKHVNPSNPMDTPMQFLHGVRNEKHLWQIFQEMGVMSGFDSMMKVWHRDRSHWADEKAGFYPFTERLVQGARKGGEEVFMVDIAGGQGNDLLRLLTLHPQENLPGKLILQDLPPVLAEIPAGFLPSAVEKMDYDFYTPQPIKGARTYFMHSIIHDYPDETAKKILKQIVDAMEKGYSKLVMWDQIVPNKGVEAVVAAQDWEMMTFLAGAERTEKQWTSLIEDPDLGLKVTGVWYYSQYDQAIVEAELI